MVTPSDAIFLPSSPGCYLFRDSQGNLVYVGKAKNLRRRVLSYFQKREHDPKTSMLVESVKDIEIITTGTEVDALLLENSLIKKHRPKYNLDLKDSQRYAYILVHDDDELPWIEVVRARNEKGEYYGPFTSGAIRKLITDLLWRNWRILTRKPSPAARKSTNKQEYALRVQQARQILRGDVESLVNQLEGQMNDASRKANYEHAMMLRDQISALRTLKDHQIIEMTRTVDANILNYLVVGSDVYLLVFSVRKGVLEDSQQFSFPVLEGFLEDFIMQYYDHAHIPQEVYLPEKVDSAMGSYLAAKSGHAVKLIVPRRGGKKALLELVAQNITTTFFAGSERMSALQEALKMPRLPRNIECFDVSHFAGDCTVASMVSFIEGIPHKANYRRFRIHARLDDCAAINEAVCRRYGGSLSASMKKPDLIVIDGGEGQLGAAHAALKQADCKIPVIALAKQFEEIHFLGRGPMRLPRNNKGLQLLQSIRDEAHRFAHKYNMVLRSKALRVK